MSRSLVFTVTTDLSHDQRMRRIAGTLAKAGYDVTLVGRQLPESKKPGPAIYKQYRFKCNFTKGPLFYLEYNLRLVFWFFSNRFDVYGAVDADTALAGVVAAALLRKPLVYDAHELFPEMPEVVNRPVVKKVWATLEKLAFARAKVAYTVSTSLVQYFEERYGRPVGLVRNMPTRQFTQPFTSEPPYFIYQGALNVGRGLEKTIQAMQQVPAQLIICGDGPLKPKLVSLVKELALEDRVIFKGNVTPEILADITTGARAGIMLLENQGLSYYYSLANKFFDYVQAGIPQVCIPFPEYRQLNARHEVALLVNLEVEEIRDSLLRLLQDQDLYQRLQQNCLQAREEWCWQREEQELVTIFESII